MLNYAKNRFFNNKLDKLIDNQAGEIGNKYRDDRMQYKLF